MGSGGFTSFAEQQDHVSCNNTEAFQGCTDSIKLHLDSLGLELVKIWSKDFFSSDNKVRMSQKNVVAQGPLVHL